MNLCRACGQDFASVKAFDAHRVGRHDYTYSQGVRMEPMREDGRRCLDVDELRAAGMELNRHGRWYIVADAERVRRHHQKAANGMRPSWETASEGSGQVAGRAETQLRVPAA